MSDIRELIEQWREDAASHRSLRNTTNAMRLETCAEQLEAAMPVWQPIKTAPRDGTPVDLWHRTGFRVTETWWTDDSCWSCDMVNSRFTHWMPLPKPPEQS